MVLGLKGLCACILTVFNLNFRRYDPLLIKQGLRSFLCAMWIKFYEGSELYRQFRFPEAQELNRSLHIGIHDFVFFNERHFLSVFSMQRLQIWGCP